MRLGGIGERQHLTHLHRELSGLDQLRALFQNLALVHARGVHTEKHGREHEFVVNALIARARGLDGIGVARRLQQRHHLPVHARGRERLAEGLATHGVEGQVHTRAAGPVERRLHEIFLFIFDNPLGAECVHERRLVGITHGCRHARERVARELHRHMPDPTGRRVNQHPFGRLDVRPIIERFPRGDQHQRHRRGRTEIQIRRHARGIVFVHRIIGSVIARLAANTAAAEIHLVARLKACDLVAHCLHHAGAVAAEDGWQLVGIISTIGAQLGIDRIHTRGVQPHPHMLR